jgi:hypothetical protein
MWRSFAAFGKRISTKYDVLYSKWPKLTAGVTMGGAAGACDVLAQKIEKPSLQVKDIDIWRTFHFTLYNGIFCGAFLQVVYNVYYPKMFSGSVISKAIKVTLFDNFIFGPFAYLPSYYVYKSLADGRTSLAGIMDYINGGWDVVLACAGIWVPTQYITFVYVPPNFRIAFHAVIGCAWDVVLSYLAPMESNVSGHVALEGVGSLPVPPLSAVTPTEGARSNNIGSAPKEEL